MSEYISLDNDESSYDNWRGWSIPSQSYSSHWHAITSRNSSYGHSAAPITISDSEDDSDIKKEDDVRHVPLSSGEYLIVFLKLKKN